MPVATSNHSGNCYFRHVSEDYNQKRLRLWRAETQKKTINLETAFTGFGDALTLAWLYPHLELYARGEKVKLLQMFGIEVADSADTDIFNAHLLELADSGQRSRLDYIQEIIGTQITPVRPSKNLPSNPWVDQKLSRWSKPVIVLCPQSNSRIREVSDDFWLNLYESLRNDFTPVIFLCFKRPCFDQLENVFWGQPIENLLCMMDRSAFVIGVDSGPMHMAGCLGVPSIALMTVTQGSCVFGHCSDVVSWLTDCSVSAVMAEMRRRLCDQMTVSIQRKNCFSS